MPRRNPKVFAVNTLPPLMVITLEQGSAEIWYLR